MERREFVKKTLSGVAGLWLPSTLKEEGDLQIIDHPSPKRRTRPDRPSTDYILLHTTEGGAAGSLEKLTRRGEATYMVDANGDVYRIMGPNQISTGAGRSMWEGKTNLDNYSINIEFVGYHNRTPTRSQLESGKELIEELRSVRKGIGDEDVIPHSMVAYGSPNRWHRNSHRGRKRCGMLFAKEDVRESLGIGSAPNFDPDVRAGRLAVADPYLESVLYGNSRAVEDSIESPAEDSSEEETVISTINRGETPWTYAGNEYADSTTTYFLGDGRVRRGDELSAEGFDFSSIQQGTKVAVGYVFGGHISGSRSAYQVAGRKWNLPSTVYRLPSGEIKTGDEINDASIPRGSLILFRR